MINAVEVHLWGTRVGAVYEREGAFYFQYDKAFIGSGIELSPVKMPLSNQIYSFPELKDIKAFRGLPGLLSDSLPDNFGNAIVEQWLISQGRSMDSFSPLEHLCYTGIRGMGALEYQPARGPSFKNEPIDITEMSNLADQIINNKKNVVLDVDSASKAQLIEIGSSVGGARAKATVAWNRSTGEIRSGQTNVGQDYEYWLFKFDNGNGFGAVEYAYYKMAQDLEIPMEESLLFEKDGLVHFATKRFDRRENEKIHMQTLGSLTHLDYNRPGACSYEYYASVARKLGCNASDMEQIFRRLVFSHKALNYDDHVKNFSFMMDRQGRWTLTPAYDLSFAYKIDNPWISKHQMSLNGKLGGITDADLISFGISIGIRPSKCKEIVVNTNRVVGNWLAYADMSKVPERLAKDISQDIMNLSGILPTQRGLFNSKEEKRKTLNEYRSCIRNEFEQQRIDSQSRSGRTLE